MAQLTGIVLVKIDGALMRSMEGAKLKLGGKEREIKSGHSVYGYTEKVVPSEIEFTMVHAQGDDLIGIQNKVDSTIEFETDTGDIYICKDMVATTPAEITGGSGEVSYAFAGEPAELS
jgi:hypothetical protein